MALAQRLNELALANSNGMLDDDEYRLLRQNVFEEYSSGLVIPVEAPIVPLARVDVHVRLHTTSSSHQPKGSPSTTRKPPPSPLRAKSTVAVAGMANLLRKATGRRTPNPVHDSPTTPKDARKSGAHEIHTTKLSLMIPKLLSRKLPEKPASRSETPRPLPDALRVSTRSPRTRTPDPALLSPASHGHNPLSRSANLSSTSLRLPPSSSEGNPLSVIRDVFDEENLTTAKDIRSVIAITEEELRTLVDAFRNLETSTLNRIRKQNARRLPTNTPENVDVLLQGREWREHRLITSPSSPLLESSSRHRHHHLQLVESDSTSTRSGSSRKTSLSQSRSISSLAKLHSSTPINSPLAPHFRVPSIKNTAPRKNSVSSTSSQGAPSFTSGAMLSPVGTPTSISRSTSHLPLRKLKELSRTVSQETIGVRHSTSEDGHYGHYGEFEIDAELVDIRRRKDELIARYNARLDFLRAKLKGAELREKLLRK